MMAVYMTTLARTGTLFVILFLAFQSTIIYINFARVLLLSCGCKLNGNQADTAAHIFTYKKR